MQQQHFCECSCSDPRYRSLARGQCMKLCAVHKPCSRHSCLRHICSESRACRNNVCAPQQYLRIVETVLLLCTGSLTYILTVVLGLCGKHILDDKLCQMHQMGHLMFTLLGCIGFGSFLGRSEHTALVGHLVLQLLQLLLCDYPLCQGFVMPTQQCSHLYIGISSRV